ncbi:hypothetical protein [Mycobacterium sp.]|uniref:hypothetical protein n=1 Tax=Mycobacterium sp. TaxID=1785 RepID=UPI003F9D3EE1
MLLETNFGRFAVSAAVTQGLLFNLGYGAILQVSSLVGGHVSKVERDVTIRALHRAGVSYREIGAQVGLSAQQCMRITKRGVDKGAPCLLDDAADVIEVGEPDAERDAAYLRKLIAEAFLPDGKLKRSGLLYRLLFTTREGYRLIVVRDEESIRHESTWGGLGGT